MNIYASYLDYALRRTGHLLPEMSGKETITLKEYQLFVAKIFLGLDSMNSLLLFQETGVGKTVTAVYMLKHLRLIYTDWTVLLILKKALIEDPWVSTIERYAPEVLKDCLFMNYDDQNFHHKFFTNIKTVSSRSRIFVIIDECHNFISKSLVKEDGRKRNTKYVYNYLSRNVVQRNNKLLCLSATPIVNDVREFQMLVNLLRPGIFPPQSLFYNKKLVNEREIISKLGCVCSYIVNNETSIFDNIEGTELFARKTVMLRYVTMSQKQEELYMKARSVERRLGISVFKIYQRMAATFVFDDIPDKKGLTLEEYDTMLGHMVADFERGLSGRHFSKTALRVFAAGGSIEEVSGAEDLSLYHHLFQHSCKFTEVCLRVVASEGKCLIFEPFIKASGIRMLSRYLEIFSISYVEFSSRTKDVRTRLVADFNRAENTDGTKIKVCIFSQSGNEGISFLSVNDIFILDMTWNEASLKQIIGRAIRLNSHASNPPERRYVNVHLIIARLNSGASSVDDALLEIIQTKSREFTQLYRVLKLASIEWIYRNFTEFPHVEDEAGFKKLVSRAIDLSHDVTTNRRTAYGENIWYTFSPLIISIHQGFKTEDGRVYDTDGHYVTTVPEPPVVRVHEGKLVYVFPDVR
ncbi:ATPase NPH1 [Eastern grey kangaroopox virus]|uniref:Nucleoside triphosphatase I n=1 Tax=Eastern grey kangaroopox virus TaxID=2042482 RepID=A0A2C9DT64_9POXV|nr:ATPase NPH1 [Eastern grey kangaroopox virus]ATI21197.1 ATPase NPH1 [Eastern grey kangaroopox virus]ATX75103.1 ATPase, NPH1 [Eastern grey kangaroopox virus]